MEVKMCSVFFLVVLVMSLDCAVGENLQQECSGDFQKLMGCLSYATGKGNTPTKECCSSVKNIKESEPKCLCYIMQQTHKGSEEIKSLGIQEAKLIQLPSACQLQNVSLSYCPKLLGISPNSPDAAIFATAAPVTPSGATTGPVTPSGATTAPVTPSGTTTTPLSEDASSGNKHIPFLAGSFVIAMLSMLIHVFSLPSHLA